jgi:hypothetical protein
MAKISTYPILSDPTINDILIGTDVQDLNITKNFSIGSIIDIIGNEFVPYVGATGNVNLGAFNITSSSFIVAGGLSSQFLKANGTLDSTVYVPATRTITINSVGYDLSANRSWDLNTIDFLTTIGTSGAATYIGKTLNIPQYQAQGSYITQLNGEATAVGPGNATVTLSNLAVISKVLTGLNITGGTVTDTDSILTAFGKVQNQINGLAGGVTYEGTWNAATNTPTLTSSVGVQGHYYVVSVPGNTNLNGITDWQLGDWAIFNGSTWQKVDNTDAVVSVNGYTGAVVLTFSDVGAPPATRTLTINGVGYDLSADRSWTVGDVRTDQTYSNPTWISTLAWGKITGTPTTLAGYGITDGALNTRTLTINGTTYDLTANRTWNVGTVTSVGTSGPLTGGTITGSGTIGITQAGASSDGYLSSTDWNTFNNKQNALTNPVTGTGTIFTLPMWSGATSLVDSPLSYGPDTFNFQYNSATGGTVNFTNIGLTAYTYSIQMNNFGSPRSTVHSYTDGVVAQSIGGTQVSRVFANGNTIIGAGAADNGYKLEVSGNLYVNSIVNATTDTDRFIVSDGGVIKYRTGAQLLSDIGAQGALTLTTTGTSGAATLIGNVLNIPQYTDQFVGTVTSVGLSMPPAFTVSNSPVTSAGTLTVVGAGNATQYVRGDGALATLPTSGTGGGASVSYYLNGSVNQGTIGGVTYYEMNRTPIIGAGTDFTRNTNGYIASFLTDAGDPALLAIPAGNWNFETYFEASSGGGSPTFYLELYKYDGTTFTLIASNSGSPKLINDGTNIEAYFSALAVPQTTLTLTDRLSIRIYVTTAGRTITLHTENNTLCQVITTFTTGLTALNGLTSQVQYFATGTSGTDFNILSAVDTHTFNFPTASAVNRGALSSSDWSTFNSKQDAITLTTTGTTGPATLIGSTLNIPQYQGGVTSFNTRTGAVTLTSSDVTTALGYTPVTDLRTLTINGETYNLTANRSWTIGVNPSAREVQTYIATASQTTFTVTGGYTVGLLDVFINGVRLTSSDFTATNGTTVVLAVGTMAGNIVDIIKYTSGFTNAVSGTGTANELAYFTGSTVIASLSTATYPSLTELSYVKGVTSSIQTQLNGKQASGNYVTTDTIQTISAQKFFATNTLTLSTTPFGSVNNTIITNSSGVSTYQGGTNFFGFNTDNHIYFSKSSLSGGNTGILEWSNTIIRTYTLKDASGTLAFTSDIPANPVGGTGTTNYLPKFTGTSTIGNSQVFDNGTNVGIATTALVADALLPIQINAGASGQAYFASNNNGGYGLLMGYDNANGYARIRNVSNTALTFETNNSEKMRLTNSGNLGLGVTPSAWGSLFNNSLVQVKTTSILGFDNNLYLGVNYYATNSSDNYIQNGFASRYVQRVGQHQWETAASGTANNSVTFSQAMTLTSGGNLLVGPTTDNGARLQVNGSATFSSTVRPSSNFAADLGTSSLRWAEIFAFSLNLTSSVTASSGIFTDGSQGLIVRPYTFAGVGTGAIYLFGVTPTNQNFLFAASSTGTSINTFTGGSINFSINGQNPSMILNSAGNVGIGTSIPSTLVQAVNDSNNSATFSSRWTASGFWSQLEIRNYSSNLNNQSSPQFRIMHNFNDGLDNGYIGFHRGSGLNGGFLSFAANGAEKVRITPDNYIRMAAGTDGIQFNGDTAAANALDDYEEGTWTPTFVNLTVTGSVTYSGVYTKIGRQVFFQAFVTRISGDVGSTSSLTYISNLPFSVNNSSTTGGAGRDGSLDNAGGVHIRGGTNQCWLPTIGLGGQGIVISGVYIV